MSAIFQIIIFIFSVMIHEIAHGAMALRLGDDTAQRLGRLTLNPLKHIDPIGSVLLPLLLVAFRSPFLIGWAKPVPYDQRFLKNPKSGAALIAVAGPASNLIIALIFGLLIRFDLFSANLTLLLAMIVYINILLAIFNLVPIPPLDGSKLLYYFLPNQSYRLQAILEQYGPIFLLIFIIAGIGLITPIINFIFQIITGAA